MNGRLPSLNLITAGLTVFVAVLLTMAWSMAIAKDQRKRVIEFDDEVVEGINKRPLDSLSQLSERGKGGAGGHLYRKRIGFRAETQQTIHEMRYSL